MKFTTSRAPSILRLDDSLSVKELHDVAATRLIEKHWQDVLEPHTLMKRAGLCAAKLALAIAPHAQRIWIAIGPGNNGGDGIEAAIHLKQWGKDVVLTGVHDPLRAPDDTQMSWLAAQGVGLTIGSEAPLEYDLAIDAILGIGATRGLEGPLRAWLDLMYRGDLPVLSLDIPSGLQADTGVWLNKPPQLNARRYTLTFLTNKPGLWTGYGREACGEIWMAPLVDTSEAELSGVNIRPTAVLNDPVDMGLSNWRGKKQRHANWQLQKNTHKGSFGDVYVIGGYQGMEGAAILAATASLHAGAGRVFAGILNEQTHSSVISAHPTLMVRRVDELLAQPPIDGNQSIVCGCGGGQAIARWLPTILSQCSRLVLDADALNAVAKDAHLVALLRERRARQWWTVLTPHPLEAARLLGCATGDVQKDRIDAAKRLAEMTQAVVILKGAGSVIAAADRLAVINTTGNSLLSTAGTGDVLAGLIGARMAQGLGDWEAARVAVYEHGGLVEGGGFEEGSPDALTLARRLAKD